MSDGENLTAETGSFGGNSRPRGQVPWDQSTRKSKPGGRPTPGEAGLPQAWPREVRATPVAPATRGLRRVLGLIQFHLQFHLTAKPCSVRRSSLLASTEVTTAICGP